jgi:hypothetical protein
MVKETDSWSRPMADFKNSSIKYSGLLPEVSTVKPARKTGIKKMN